MRVDAIGPDGASQWLGTQCQEITLPPTPRGQGHPGNVGRPAVGCQVQLQDSLGTGMVKLFVVYFGNSIYGLSYTWDGAYKMMWALAPGSAYIEEGTVET